MQGPQALVNATPRNSLMVSASPSLNGVPDLLATGIHTLGQGLHTSVVTESNEKVKTEVTSDENNGIIIVANTANTPLQGEILVFIVPWAAHC